MILLSEEILVISDICVHNRIKICRKCMDPKYVLALILANAFEIIKFEKLKDIIAEFLVYG